MLELQTLDTPVDAPEDDWRSPHCSTNLLEKITIWLPPFEDISLKQLNRQNISFNINRDA